jgi:hypothetical protein
MLPVPGAAEMIKELQENIIDEETIVLGKPEDLDRPLVDKGVEEEPASEPEVEAAVEQEPDIELEDDLVDDALSDDAKKRGKAFGAMRAEAKELKERWEASEKEKQEMRERLARLEGRAEATAKPEAAVAEDKEPDAVLYPEDHNAWKIRQMEQRVEKAERTAADAAAFANWQREQRGMQSLEASYKAANPSEKYDEAMQFLVEKERAAKKLMNPKLTDAQADEMTQSEKLQLFKSLHQQGRDPASVLMQVAKMQGFMGATAAAKPKVDLKKVEENQRRSASLIGGSPAAAKDKKLGTDDVFNMAFGNVLKNHKQLTAMVDGEGE